ncbi:hypothetical protein UCRPC4_g03848 [Phaeomoniella chlamydospora]|uniref:Uncharacterized protein n=1 Tax=Phaeomoniella chlamydospora TaxID=158046 RepID=A0A0G2EE24_PHACM|nr:hypothetical protein UCRPC4_g03848 [Phaeomoniella chlamydospora]
MADSGQTSLPETGNFIYPLANLLSMRHGHCKSLVFQGQQNEGRLRNIVFDTAFLAVKALMPRCAEKQWVLIFKAVNDKTVIIELKQADPCGRTFVLCREGPDISGDTQPSEFAQMWQIQVNENSIAHVVDHLTTSRLANYQLSNGEGELS